jgi:hypothetical protein
MFGGGLLLLPDFATAIATATTARLRWPASRLFHQFLLVMAQAKAQYIASSPETSEPPHISVFFLRKLFAAAFKAQGFQYVSYQGANRFHSSKIILIDPCTDRLSEEDLDLSNIADPCPHVQFQLDLERRSRQPGPGHGWDNDSQASTGDPSFPDLSQAVLNVVECRYVFTQCLLVTNASQRTLHPVNVIREAAYRKLYKNFTETRLSNVSIWGSVLPNLCDFALCQILESSTNFRLHELSGMKSDHKESMKKFIHEGKKQKIETQEAREYTFSPTTEEALKIDGMLALRSSFANGLATGMTPTAARALRALKFFYVKFVTQFSGQEELKGRSARDHFLATNLRESIPCIIKWLFPTERNEGDDMDVPPLVVSAGETTSPGRPKENKRRTPAKVPVPVTVSKSSVISKHSSLQPSSRRSPKGKSTHTNEVNALVGHKRLQRQPPTSSKTERNLSSAAKKPRNSRSQPNGYVDSKTEGTDHEPCTVSVPVTASKSDQMRPKGKKPEYTSRNTPAKKQPTRRMPAKKVAPTTKWVSPRLTLASKKIRKKSQRDL